MSRGPSGRIVVEVEPDLKRELYSELSLAGLTLKDWFIRQAKNYISENRRPSLFDAEALDRNGKEPSP